MKLPIFGLKKMLVLCAIACVVVLLFSSVPYSANFFETHKVKYSSPESIGKLKSLIESQPGVKRVLISEANNKLEISWTMVRNLAGSPEPPPIDDLLNECGFLAYPVGSEKSADDSDR